jgi:membrane protein
MKALAMGATILKEALVAWNEDKVPRLGAALAYYTLFSLAPLLMIVVAVVSLVFGEQAAQGQIADEIKGLVGDKGAEAIQAILQNAGARKSSGIVATVIGIMTLLFGASGVFGELQDALNTIWGVKPKPGRGIFGIVRSRFFSFAMVLGIVFLLLVSLVVSAALAALGKFGSGTVPTPLFHIVDLVVSVVVVAVLFATIFKVLPDVRIAWRDVWIGAFATSVFFTFGKILIGLYLGRSSVGSAFGAAGSLVVVLVWIYYSAQILFLGAELTKAYAHQHAPAVVPTADAVPVKDEVRHVDRAA